MSDVNRLDKEIHARGLAKSRTAAAELVRLGRVTVNGEVCLQPSRQVCGADELAAGELIPFVSRGGVKLAHALETFHIDLSGGSVCLDVGASTGGFTDCMLQRGASRVYAVDVGTGQLDPALLADSRVVSMEKCDIRGLESLPEQVEFIGIDVSFISLKLILPHLSRFTTDVGAWGVALIKPQFELGVKHSGVVKSRRVRERAVDDVVRFTRELGIKVLGTAESPIAGGSGNVEYLMWFEVGE